jgi:hypothetical protein
MCLNKALISIESAFAFWGNTVARPIGVIIDNLSIERALC